MQITVHFAVHIALQKNDVAVENRSERDKEQNFDVDAAFETSSQCNQQQWSGRLLLHLHSSHVVGVDGGNDSLGLPAKLFAFDANADRLDVFLHITNGRRINKN